jgi:hypothetical protein
MNFMRVMERSSTCRSGVSITENCLVVAGFTTRRRRTLAVLNNPPNYETS